MWFSSGVYLYFRNLMYANCHEQFENGCGAILNKIFYNIVIIITVFSKEDVFSLHINLSS